ncbi:MAG TPA: DUF5696 domain-containing protein [Patescibacteria group bacterium]|nr:DUF5696 domain-containing protein [Patescibacteria group bacterium]
MLQAAEVSIDTAAFRFSIAAETGHCEILDKKSQITWGAQDRDSSFGTVTLKNGEKTERMPLGRCEVSATEKTACAATFHPLPERPETFVRVRFQTRADLSELQVSYETSPGLQIESLTPFAQLVRVSDSGYIVVPVREGLLIPADSGLSFTHRFDTYAYEGCHMEMIGAVQHGSALLVTWNDPYTAIDVQSVVRPDSTREGQQVSANCTLSRTSRALQLRLLGPGDYVSITKAYRQIAKERGLLVTWDQKLRRNPNRSQLFGAANIKLWSALDRRMNEDSTKEEEVKVNWTFDEAAQVAKHFKDDLKLDRVLFTMGGWIHRGYDNQHPDILPTAPECGGDSAFTDCAQKVRAQGYIFCLHDNYQDMYRDCPSWDERFIMKTRDGKLARGGHWAGGMAFLTCSEMALELAKRPQNLPAVRRLSNANAYFIDTTYAAGLQECFDPQHPLTRRDDIKWKQALSDYARSVFGVFGSECGREWAIPHSDFFEGLTGVSGHAYHDAKLPDQLGATVVPLFELVYRDCIAMYGKYGYDPAQAARYVLQHISLGRPLNYHSIPAHLYWKSAAREPELAVTPGIGEIRSKDSRQFAVTYKWIVDEPISESWRIFVHFVDASGNIKFQNDQQPSPPTSEWKTGEVLQGPFTVTIPEGLSGDFEVRMGLFHPENGQRALLQGRRNRDRSYAVGKIALHRDKIEFLAGQAPPPRTEGMDLFTRAHNGWASGMHPLDCFIKNTYEVLSPLNELTARMQMTRHEFLTPDRNVQRTVFGEGDDRVTVTVNLGNSDYSCTQVSDRTVRLPPLGFLIDSQNFVAFYAGNWNGLDYQSSPPLFTLRALDKRPLSKSHQVRVFHAFGNDRIQLRKMLISVTREKVIDPNP